MEKQQSLRNKEKFSTVDLSLKLSIIICTIPACHYTDVWDGYRVHKQLFFSLEVGMLYKTRSAHFPCGE